MKAFSPAGMAVKAFYGYALDGTYAPVPGSGVKTLGNPDGATSGGGAYAAGGPSPQGPNQSGRFPPVAPTLALTIAANHLAADASGAGVKLSSLMTSAQLTAWLAGTYGALTLAGTGSPGPGYWVIAGKAGLAGGGGQALAGLIIDQVPATPVTITIDLTLLRFYGGGGQGGTEGSPNGNGSAGGDAIHINSTATTVNLICNIAGDGVIFGGGGGARFGASPGPAGGGCGAAGWFPGVGAPGASGPTGGIFDPENAGTGDPDVPGGAGGPPSNANGGGLGAAGSGGTEGIQGAGGAAVNRNGVPGTTTVNGGSAATVRGAVT